MVWRGWQGYWFRPAALFDLAVFRILVVAFQLVWLLRRDYLGRLYEHAQFPDWMFGPLPLLRVILLPFSPDGNLPFAVLAIVFWLTLVAGSSALIGFRTNASLAAFAAGCLFMQLYLYSFGTYHHPSALVLIVLAFLSLSPAGAVLSVDDVLRRVRANLQARALQLPRLAAETSPFARWPLLLTTWLVALAYLSAAASKLHHSGLDWLNGYTLQYYLIRDGLRWESALGVWLGSHHGFALVGSWFAIFFEATFFLVILFPVLALVYVPAGLGFHTLIYLTQRAPFFGTMVLYAALVPWAAGVRYLAERYARPHAAKPEVFYDGLCPLCIRSMTILAYFDWFGRLRYSDLEVEGARFVRAHPTVSLEDCREEMHLRTPDGTIHRGFFAFRRAVLELPPLWPLLPLVYVPGAATLGPMIYRAIAARRSRLEPCSFDACALEREM